MRIEDLMFPRPIIDILRKGAENLNPPQKLALENGLLEGKNLVIASPTASGKTLIAEMAFLKNFLNHGKTVYLVPLRALGSEKYEEFKKRYTGIGMKIALSVGDMDKESEWLGNYDLIIASNEKMDSLLRHEAKWISSVSLIICDEIHVLNDPGRGPTLEIVLTRLKELANAQVLALSATISNADEIARWLGAKLVRSDYRPVKLYPGVCYPEKDSWAVEYHGKPDLKIHSKFEPEIAMTEDTVKRGKQALLFLSTRRNSEAAAEKVSFAVEKNLTKDEKEKLKIVSKEIASALPAATVQCKRLAGIVARGAAFHHAGLVAKQRKIIEDNFRSGLIKILASTSSLAFGMNLPAWRVVVRDMKRFSGYGSDFLPVLDVQQMCGRAGRPAYDTEGEAILVAKSEREKEELKEKYIFGEPEPIYSKLSSEPVLRMHLLALIASGTTKTKNDIQKFFSRTFFAHQYGDIGQVMKKVEKILAELESYSFIEIEKEDFILPDFVPAFSLAKDVKLTATKIGRRVSELYVDPWSANMMIKNLKPMTDLEYIMVIGRCLEMLPVIRTKSKEYDQIEGELERCGLNTPDAWNIDYEDFIDLFKTSIVIRDWMNEFPEGKLLDTYGVAPGELHNRMTNAEWLLYSARELALLLEKRPIANHLNKLRMRIKHGVKEELLRLVKLKGIGRVRARLLFKNGIKGAADIRNSTEKLEKILGKGVARQILEQLGNK